uniref:Uncharacterized protein n=1 Tax=Romanomermis culicivorax TaxID=13658 RepID=A0A915I5J8_ROMCU
MLTDSSSASSQSSKVPLALPALPSISVAATVSNSDARTSNQPMSTANTALIDNGAQCSVLSSHLVKCAFDKQSLQLPICRKIKVTHGAIITANGPVVITMESMFGEHMIKCVILNDNSKAAFH